MIFTPSSLKDLGGYTFPFLNNYKKWKVVSTKFLMGEEGELVLDELLAKKPTVRIVKDDGVTDIYAYGSRPLKLSTFLKATGLRIDMPDDPQTGKRLSRILRPSIAYRTFMHGQMPVVELDVDKDLWDGMNLITREAVELLTEHLDERTKRAFRSFNRFEITVMTERGQAKGHALVVDSLPYFGMIGVPKGSWKKQVTFHGGVFVDIRPVKAHTELMADVQTIINHYGVLFDQETLMGWLEEESEKYLEAMRTGEAGERMKKMLENIASEKEFRTMMRFPMFEFLLSGGKLNWSPHFTRQFGRMWAKKLESKSLMGHRLPIKSGFRVYLTAASCGGLTLKEREAYVDFSRSSIFISDHDYVKAAKILGGGDQDDAVNCIWDGTYVLLTRNPNMRGEYWGARLVNPSELTDHGIEPIEVDWRKLKTFRSISEKEYGSLKRIDEDHPKDYEGFANWLMVRVAHRLGVLGKHINVLAAYILTMGDEPKKQPAKGEEVIDASVKDLTIDTSPVEIWDEKVAKKLSKKPLCRDAQRRLQGFLPFAQFKDAKGHWLDELEDRVQAHIEWFLEEVEKLASKACPPAEVFISDVGNGSKFKDFYNTEIWAATKEGLEPDFEAIDKLSLKYLKKHKVDLLGAYAASILEGGNDACVWQKSITKYTLEALRKVSVLGLPNWDGYKVWVLGGKNPTPTTRLKINGTWCAVIPSGPKLMRDVPKAERALWKRRVIRSASNLNGRSLAFCKKEDRILAYSDSNTFLGYVGRECELPAYGVVISAVGDREGNLHIVAA